MADQSGSPSPSRQSYRQLHTYSPQRCHTPSFGQRYPHQASNDLPQRLDTSMAPSQVNSYKRSASAHHTSYLGHLPTFPSNGIYLNHSNSQLSSSTALPSATSPPVGCDNYLVQLSSLTPVEMSSHLSSSRQLPPSSHSRVHSMSVAPSGHSHSYLQPNTSYSPNNVSGGSIHVGQGKDQPFPVLNVNTMNLSSSYQNEYAIHSPTNHYQSHAIVPSFIPNSSLSPLSPHFSDSQSSSPSSPTPMPNPTPATHPRVETVGDVPHLPPSLTYPASSTRPFGCEQCKLSFMRQHDLKRHKETHTGIRPHVCFACGKSYTRKDALVRHQMVKQCGKAALRKKNDVTYSMDWRSLT